MQVAPGQTLSHYRVLDKLGEGGMGVVWRALDTTLDREVAIKILPQAVAGDAERLARFEREAKVLASLNHPHIATIHGLEEAEGVRFLVMELVEGQDLAERLSSGPIAVETALALAVQLAEALEAAHEQGIVHRDLKPANLKIGNDDNVKVLDFGLAKALDPEATDQSGGSSSLSPTVTSAGTAAGMILGTAAYMSPEQAKGKPVDRRADIWAFGVVLHEMLTGRRVFGGESISETLAAVIMGEPDLGALPSNTPLRVRRLLERCLRKDPQSRLRDVGDARLVLEESLAGHEWKTAGLATAETSRLFSWPTVLLGLGCVAVGAIVAMLFTSLSPSAPTSVQRFSIVTESPSPFPEVTPDGAALLYVGVDGLLAVRPFESYEERSTIGTEGAGFRALSPDGRWVAFMSGEKLLKVPLDGSAPPVELADPPLQAAMVWTERDQIVMITTRPYQLARIPAGGGAALPAVEISSGDFGQNIFHVTSPLPDGRHVLAAADSYGEDGWQMNVVLIDVETGAAHRIIENGVFAQWSPTGHLVFSRKDSLLALPFDDKSLSPAGGPVALLDGLWVPQPTASGWFRFSRNGTLAYRTGGNEFEEQLVVIDRDGEVEPWTDERRDYGESLIVSPDQRLVAAHVINWTEGLEEIWVADFEQGRLQPLVDERGLDCTNPVWSSDSTSIYYQCLGPGDVGGVYRRRVDGSSEPELLLARESESRMFFPTSLSPDGGRLLLIRGPEASALVSLRVDGADPATPEVLLDAGSSWTWGIFGAGFSPDGNWIAYDSVETGRLEVYLRSVAADGSLGPKKLITKDGGRRPRWTGRETDGRPELIYMKGTKMFASTIGTERGLSVSEPQEVLDAEEHRVVYATPLADGRFLIAQADEPELSGGVRINVVLNWFEELERLAPIPD